MARGNGPKSGRARRIIFSGSPFLFLPLSLVGRFQHIGLGHLGGVEISDGAGARYGQDGAGPAPPRALPNRGVAHYGCAVSTLLHHFRNGHIESSSLPPRKCLLQRQAQDLQIHRTLVAAEQLTSVRPPSRII